MKKFRNSHEHSSQNECALRIYHFGHRNETTNSFSPLKRLKKRKFHNKIAVGMILSVACAAGFYAAQPAKAAVNLTLDSVIPKGVTLQGKDISGMTADQITEYVEECTAKELNKTLFVKTEEETLEFLAADYGVTWNNPEVLDELIDLIPTGNVVEKYKKIKDVEANPVALSLDFTVDEESLKNDVYDYMLAHTMSPIEPSIERDGTGFKTVEGENGIGFNVEVSNEDLLEGMLNPDETEIALTYVEIPPTYTIDAFDNFKGDLLGNYWTDYSDGSDDRDQNLIRAAEILNGTVLMPGEEFSFLTDMGDITEENGFRNAPVIQNGAYHDSIGGGLCQVATTLYNAVLIAELQVVQRQNHSMAGGYIPFSFDAMVYPNPYNPEDKSLDFRFINNLENPIYIETYCDLEQEQVYFSIYGTEYRTGPYEVIYQYADGSQDACITISGTGDAAESTLVVYRQDVMEFGFPETGAFEVHYDSTLALGDPLYYLEQGYANPWGLKVHVETNPHYEVKSELYKEVYVNGELISSTHVNSRIDQYDGETGVIYLAEDVELTGVDLTLIKGGGHMVPRYQYTGEPYISRVTQELTRQHEENLRKQREAEAAAQAANAQ